MRQLYVFTAGDLKARAHLNDSIRGMVPIRLLDTHLKHDQAEYLKSLLPNSSGFNAWGAVPGPRNIPMWEAMQEGDAVFTVYGNQYHYISSVISKVHNASLAEEIWGVDDDGKTWEYIYILTCPKPVNVHVLSTPVSGYLNNGYRGFTRISDGKVDHIRQDYGSIENFVEEVFSTELPATVVERQLLEAEIEVSGFDPTNLVDGRKKILAEITRRRGQPRFRREVLEAYRSVCAVSGCDVEAVLEAAHIIAYLGDQTNHVSNGLLLRADIHTLFDLGELKIDALGIVHISQRLENTIYGQFHGHRILFPDDPRKGPNKEALAKVFSQVV